MYLRSRDKRVIYLPILLILVGTVGRVMILVFDVMFTTRFEDPVFVAQDNALNIVVLWTVLAETWYSTGLICYRLWAMERQKRATGAADDEGLWSRSTHRYGTVMRVLIQSGMLHSVELVAFITCLSLQYVSLHKYRVCDLPLTPSCHIPCSGLGQISSTS